MRKSLLIACAFIACLFLSACSKHEAAQKYIVQVFTGGWFNENYTPEQVIDRLEAVSEKVPVEKVIIGWNLNEEPYRKIGEYLHSKGIQMLLWIPVFSEVGHLYDAELATDLWGKAPEPYELQEGEDFTFYCPSSAVNTDNIIRLYEEHFADCGFDGVFIDKIRTQSFVGGVSGVLNCGCESCAEYYASHGIDLEAVKTASEAKGDAFLSVSSYSPETGFVFADPLAAEFFEVKGQLVAESVAKVADYFHDKGMLVGMDLYAPVMSQFVGQNYELLSAHADFIKPMLYRKTEAPAGISFEYDLLKKSIPQAEGYPEFTMDAAFLEGQLAAAAKAGCDIYPGIEVNYREEFARTSPEYIMESLSAVSNAGFAGAVLSWDIMLAPDSHLEAIRA